MRVKPEIFFTGVNTLAYPVTLSVTKEKKKVFNFDFRFDVVAEPTVVASADSAGVADQDAQLEETLVEGGRPRTTSASSKGSPTR